MRWWYQVQWRRGPGQGNYVDSFPAARVRLDTVDRTGGFYD